MLRPEGCVVVLTNEKLCVAFYACPVKLNITFPIQDFESIVRVRAGNFQPYHLIIFLCSIL